MAKYFKWSKQSWWEKQNWRHHISRFHKATKINQCGISINRDILANGTRNPHLYDQLIFDKHDKNMQQERTISSPIYAISKYNWSI